MEKIKAQETKITLPTFTVLERAVLYARVSGDDSRKDGRNLAGQLDMGREYARSKGYRIVAELAEDDKGASGYEIDLPELNKIREMAYRGEFDILIVRELDRLSRNLAKQLIVEEELRRTGVRIEYVLVEYDDSAEGRFQKHIRATVAEYEREKIKERMLRGKENASKRGKVLINIAPFGYDLVDGQLIINPTEAEIVRLIYCWYIFELETLYGICKRLDEMGVIRQGKSNAAQRKRDYAIGWTPDAVRRILTSETYTGTFYYSHKKIPVTVPAIINQELFKLTQERLEENRRVRKPRQYNYLLSGMGECGHCHNSYVAYTNTFKDKTYPRYACAARRNPKIHAAKCNAAILKADKVDDMVWNWIREFLGDPDRLQRYIDDYNDKISKANEPLLRQIESINALIAENQFQMNRLITAYQKGALELDDIAGQRDQLKTTITKLVQQREKREEKLSREMLTQEEINDILAFAQRISKGVKWADKNPEDKRKLVKALRTKVVFIPAGDKTEVFVSCALGATRNNELIYDDN